CRADQAVFADGDERRSVVAVLFRGTFAEQIADGLLAGLLWRSSLLHAHHDAVTETGFQDLVSVSGGRRAADLVVHIEAGADDRGVAHAPRNLPRHAARRAADGEIAVHVEDAEADGVMVVGG